MNNNKNVDNIEIIVDSENNLIIDFNIIDVSLDIPELDNPKFD